MIIDEISRVIIIAEVTVCFDLYFGFSFPVKCGRYQELCDFLRENGWKPSLHVLCFGALGCIKDDDYKRFRNIGFGKAKTKELLDYCSISNIIGANYIWRHRVKRSLILFITFFAFVFGLLLITPGCWLHQD